MKYFVVRYEHNEFEGWKVHLIPHIKYIQEEIAAGNLLMSGPLEDSPTDLKEAILVFKAESREALQVIIERDPYWTEGLVSHYVVREWNPMFGILGYSSEQIAAGLNNPELLKNI